MVPWLLAIALGQIMGPVTTSGQPISIQRPVPAPAPAPLPFHPFHHFHHFPVFFVPVVVYGDGFTTCEQAARMVHASNYATDSGSRDVVIAYVDQPESATSLLYGLRAAGYPDVRLVSLQLDSGSRYRAEFRLGRRDASLC